MRRLHMKAKAWWYRTGHRPKVGSLLFSPSLSLIYAFKDGAEQMERRAAKMRHPAYKHIAKTVRENKFLDPTLADQPQTRAAHQSNRFCHHWDHGSMCGYPAIGWVGGVTACRKHYDDPPHAR